MLHVRHHDDYDTRRRAAGLCRQSDIEDCHGFVAAHNNVINGIIGEFHQRALAVTPMPHSR